MTLLRVQCHSRKTDFCFGGQVSFDGLTGNIFVTDRLGQRAKILVSNIRGVEGGIMHVIDRVLHVQRPYVPPPPYGTYLSGSARAGDGEGAGMAAAVSLALLIAIGA